MNRSQIAAREIAISAEGGYESAPELQAPIVRVAAVLRVWAAWEYAQYQRCGICDPVGEAYCYGSGYHKWLERRELTAS